jgi:hypothetical protein
MLEKIHFFDHSCTVRDFSHRLDHKPSVFDLEVRETAEYLITIMGQGGRDWINGDLTFLYWFVLQLHRLVHCGLI